MADPPPGPSSASRERVLGIVRADVPGGLDWRGLRTHGVDELLAAVADVGEFRVRADAEDDPGFQQIIPYVIVTDGPSVFLMRRLWAGADRRLHDRRSIGVGGHIGIDDGGVAGGLAREWTEELVAAWVPEFEPVGVLNDDSDPVGAVHLGVVYRVEAAGRPVAIRETHKLEGAFASIDAADALGDRLETWSRICLDHLRSGVVAT